MDLIKHATRKLRALNVCVCVCVRVEGSVDEKDNILLLLVFLRKVVGSAIPEKCNDYVNDTTVKRGYRRH